MKIMLAVFQLDKRGGKERDCIAIARFLMTRGHDVRILTTSVNLTGFDDLRPVSVPVGGFANHTRARAFAEAVLVRMAREKPDLLFAFERIPGADFYYAADAATALRPRRLLSWMPRRRTQLGLESGVLRSSSQTHIFFVTARQRDDYIGVYGLDPSRATVLPMILHEDRYVAAPKASPDKWRRHLGIPNDAVLAVSIAVNPKLKGADRTLEAMVHHPRLMLLLAGSNARWIGRRVCKLKLQGRVHIVPYLTEVMDLMAAADLLVHPARSEAAGQVIGEALLGGVPALVSGICGYAGEIARSGAGIVLSEPFEQEDLVAGLATMMDSLPAMRQAAADQSLYLQQQRGLWLKVVAERIERGA